MTSAADDRDPADRDPGDRDPGGRDLGGRDLVAVMTGFARTLRAAGVPADHARTQGLLRALSHLDAARPGDVYWAGRLTLCASAEDLPRYDRVFAAYFGGLRAGPARSATVTVTRHVATLAGESGDGGERESAARPAGASELEVLRNRDVARLTAAELAECTGCWPCSGPGASGAGRGGPGRRGADGSTPPRRSARPCGAAGRPPGCAAASTAPGPAGSCW